jgi:hypothetical protein
MEISSGPPPVSLEEAKQKKEASLGGLAPRRFSLEKNWVGPKASKGARACCKRVLANSIC